MKIKLAPASFVPLAQEVVIAADRGDLDNMKKCIANGGETALLLDDVPIEQAPDPGLVNFDGVILRSMHEDGDALNAAMYWAAYRGHRHVVEYFLETGDYCKTTLGLCLYGAVCANDEAMVKMLVEAGADPCHGDRHILERAIARCKPEISDYMVEKSREYSHALAAYISNGKLTKALEMLDHDVDVRKGLDALANRMTDRAMLVALHDQERYLDMFETLLGYAEAKGDDMNDVILHAVSFADNHWSSAVAERLIGNAHFSAHPEKQDMLDRLTRRTVLSSNKVYDNSYHEYCELVEKMIAVGATQEVILRAAVAAANAEIAMLVTTADPRRGKPSTAEMAHKRLQQFPHDEDLMRICKLVDVQADVWSQLEKVLMEFYAKDKKPVEALRHVDNFKGRSCFMMAVLGGRAAEAVDTFVNAGAKLCHEDLFTKDKTGVTLCDLIGERDLEPLFIDRRLFASAKDYQSFWDNLTPEAKDTHAERHHDVLAAFAAMEALSKLSQSNGAAQKRYKL